MSQLTEHRRTLRAAVEPLLSETETLVVAVARCEYQAGLNRLGFTVTVTVGEPGGEEVAERLDELLEPEGGVRAALQEAEATVTKTSGYRTFQGPEGPVLGSEWTVELLT